MINSLEKLEFNIGGYSSSNYWVTINNSRITCSASYYPIKTGKELVIYGEALQIEKFIEVLNNIDIVKWEDTYSDNDILDGVQWEIKINFNNSIQKSIIGSNDFPSIDINGENVFELFEEGIKKLVNEPLFFDDEFIEKIENL